VTAYRRTSTRSMPVCLQPGFSCEDRLQHDQAAGLIYSAAYAGSKGASTAGTRMQQPGRAYSLITTFKRWYRLVGVFLLEAALISLSGVLAPGPMTAVTVGEGTRSPHAGAWIAVGHGIIEIPLMIGVRLRVWRCTESSHRSSGDWSGG